MKMPKKVVFLGFVLQLIWKDKNGKEKIKTWSKPTGRKPCTLCCNSNGKNIFLFPWVKAQEVDLPIGAKKEKSKFESWSGFIADSAFTIDLKHDDLKFVGEPIQIIYFTDKWTGEAAQHIHRFETNHRLYNNKSIIWGLQSKSGKRLISPDGIIG